MTLAAQVLEKNTFADRKLSLEHSQYSDLSKKVPTFLWYGHRTQLATGAVGDSQELHSIQIC